MAGSFVRIEESEFQLHRNDVIVLSCDGARAYAIVTTENERFSLAIAWASDLVDPIVVNGGSDDVLWIGLDTRVCAVRPSLHRLELLVGIPSNVIDICPMGLATLVLCETHLIVIDAENCISRQIDLPEIPETLHVRRDEVLIHMIDGEEVCLRI